MNVLVTSKLAIVGFYMSFWCVLTPHIPVWPFYSKTLMAYKGKRGLVAPSKSELEGRPL